MVMATGSLCPPYDTGDLSHENRRRIGRAASARCNKSQAADEPERLRLVAEGDQQAEAAEAPHDEAAADAAALHERLVAYVHALAPPHESRSGVWVEHSYARARGAAHAPASHVRVLLAPRAPPPDERLDVERLDASPPPLEPPEPAEPAEPAEPDGDERDWEPRVTALAPSAAHAALAERALDVLRRLRLARLAAPAAAGEHTRDAARRLRHALAAACVARGPATARPAPWLHATLLAYLPRGERRLYDALLGELARAAPRVAARLAGGRAPAPRRVALARVAAPLGGAGEPWLLWLGGGSARQDRRWRRRLGALLHTRVLAAPAPDAAPPEAWCAAVAGSMRAALTDALAEAGERPVIVGGAGAGAALAVALAGGAGAGAGVRGALLLALPLASAEGARTSPDEPLLALRVPALLVAGARAPGAAQLRALAGPARRVLELRGADGALRLPAALRRRLRLPQHALDAAVAEECARWALETVEGGAGEAEGAEDAAACASPSPPPPVRRRRARPAPPDDDEYAHLPAATARADKPPEVVVSRGSGATPLALLPPRRAAPPPPAPPPAPAAPAALAAADIMRLPIVFADDEPVPPAPARRGAAAPYARVIVASRGPPRPPHPARAPRPVLLRRAVRVLARAAPR